MDRCREPGQVGFHQTSAPPPKLKKLRKNDEAANAIDRPKTIWTSRRNPPDESPNASVSPVTTMMMTPTTFGDRALDRVDDRLERGLPRHVRAGRPGGQCVGQAEGERGGATERKTASHACSPVGGVRGDEAVAAVRVETLDADELGQAALGAAAVQHGDDVDRLGDQRARHARHGFEDQLLEPVERRAGGAGMDRANPAGMAGTPGFEQIEGLGPADLADRNSVGAQSQARTDEIAEGDARRGSQRNDVGCVAAQLARVLDQNDPVAGRSRNTEQRVGQRRLAGRGAAGDEDVGAVANRLREGGCLARRTLRQQ